MSTPDQVVGRLNAVARSMQTRQTTALRQAAEAARPIMHGVPGVPSRVAKRAVGVRVKVQGPDTVTVGYDPLMRLVDSPTQPHFIGPRRRGQGSLRRQGSFRGSRRATAMAVASLFGGTVGTGTHGAINIPGVGPRAWAHHPGTKGKHFSPVGKALARPVITNTYGTKMLTEPLKAAFHG